jgi:hypothetical protein
MIILKILIMQIIKRKLKYQQQQFINRESTLYYYTNSHNYEHRRTKII